MIAEKKLSLLWSTLKHTHAHTHTLKNLWEPIEFTAWRGIIEISETVSLRFWGSSSANSLVSANNAHMFSLVPKLRGSCMALISQLPWQSTTLFGNVYRFVSWKEGQENQHARSWSASKPSPNPHFFSFCTMSGELRYGAWLKRCHVGSDVNPLPLGKQALFGSTMSLEKVRR